MAISSGGVSFVAVLAGLFLQQPKAKALLLLEVFCALVVNVADWRISLSKSDLTPPNADFQVA